MDGLDEAMQQFVDNPSALASLPPPNVDLMMEATRQTVLGWRPGFDTGWLRDTLSGYINASIGTETALADTVNSRGWGDFHSGMASFWLGIWDGQNFEPPLYGKIERPHPLVQNAALRLPGKRGGARQAQIPPPPFPFIQGPDIDPSCTYDPGLLDCYPYADLGYPPYPEPMPPNPAVPDPWFDLQNPKTPKPRKYITKNNVCFFSGEALWYIAWVVKGMGSGGFIIADWEAWAIMAGILVVGGELHHWLC